MSFKNVVYVVVVLAGTHRRRSLSFDDFNNGLRRAGVPDHDLLLFPFHYSLRCLFISAEVEVSRFPFVPERSELTSKWVSLVIPVMRLAAGPIFANDLHRTLADPVMVLTSWSILTLHIVRSEVWPINS